MFKLLKKSQDTAEYVVDLIVEAFNAFCLKLNEETLRPNIVNLTKWATKGESHRTFMILKIFNGVLMTLKEFFVPCFTIYFDTLILESMQVAF